MASLMDLGVVWSVLDYGTKVDGETLDSPAIQKAIDACADAGGGVVWVPRGTYLIGTLELKDNINLHLDRDAVLLGTLNHEDYGLAGDTTHRRGCLLYARGAKGIAVTGAGTIDGRGKHFPCVGRHDSVPAFRGEVKHSQVGPKRAFRPRLVEFFECEDITFRDVTLKDSASWGAHFIACRWLRFDGVKVRNRARPNGDGLDFETCSDVYISNCDIDCDDDAICLKSSVFGQPCERYTITNCIISSNTAAVKFGTPSAGGFRNITMSNCVFYNCALGAFKLEAVDGGILENVLFSNIVMDNVEGPIFIRLGKRQSRFNIVGVTDKVGIPEELPVSVLRNVQFSNIRATVNHVFVDDPMEYVDVDPKSKQGIFIMGLDGHPVENLTFSDVHITFPGGGTQEDAEIDVPEDETMYPEQFFFGAIPAYGAFIRHAKGVVLNNVRFDLASTDLRPAVVAEQVRDLIFTNFRAASDPAAASVVLLRNANEVTVQQSKSLTDTAALVKVEKGDPGEVLCFANDLRKAVVELA